MTYRTNAVVLGFLVAVISPSIGCRKTECSAAALSELVATPAPNTNTLSDAVEAEEATERQRVSAGIRAACPGMSAGFASRLESVYEGTRADADSRAEFLASSGPEIESEAWAPWWDKVCPERERVFADVSRLPAGDRGRHVWEGCNFARLGLYDAFPTKPGERGWWSHVDFPLYAYLKDQGVDEGLAREIVRRLGTTILEPVDSEPLEGEAP